MYPRLVGHLGARSSRLPLRAAQKCVLAWARLLLAGTIELERALRETAALPPIPPNLAREYAAAL